MENFKFVKTITIKNNKLSEEALENLFDNQVATPKFNDKLKENERNIQNIKNHKDLIILINGNQMINGIPVITGNSMFVMPLPELITFYFNSVFSLYNQSNDLMSEMKSQKNIKVGDMIILNPVDSNSHFLLILRITIFSYLSTIIEFVLNKNIPEKFDLSGKTHQKKDIEVSFDVKAKIKLLIETGKINLSASSKLFQDIIECYQIRSQILHPKVASSKIGYDSIYKVYPKAFNQCHMYIKAVIGLVEILEPNLLEFVDE